MTSKRKKTKKLNMLPFIILLCTVFLLLFLINLPLSENTDSGQGSQTEHLNSSMSESNPENLANIPRIPQKKLPTREMTIGEITITAEVADNDDTKAMGLSWRESLGENEGMLFIYEQAENPSFWMYGMNFPLDFIWIRNGKVVELFENAPAPQNFNQEPFTLSPETEVTHVLEVNAGFIEKHDIKIGDMIQIH
jgi:uncharacterized protein